jgi:hypothetical protein
MSEWKDEVVSEWVARMEERDVDDEPLCLVTCTSDSMPPPPLPTTLMVPMMPCASCLQLLLPVVKDGSDEVIRLHNGRKARTGSSRVVVSGG